MATRIYLSPTRRREVILITEGHSFSGTVRIGDEERTFDDCVSKNQRIFKLFFLSGRSLDDFCTIEQ